MMIMVVSVLTIQTAPAQGTAVCPAGMIDYWELDEAAPDFGSLISSRDATCTACPDPVGGIANGAQSFDGTCEVNVAYDPVYDWGPTAGFTVEFWIRSDYVCPGDDNQYNGIIAGRYDGGAGDNLNLWWVGISCATSSGMYDQGVIRFVLKDDNTAGVPNAYGGTVVTDGDWHHVAAVRNSATNENLIYVDGSQDAVVSAGPYSDGFDASTDLNIGYLNFSTGYYLDADVDELAIYDVALSDTEILEHFNRGNSENKGYCMETPEITTSPVLSVNLEDTYTYDVDAMGDPEPSFDLLEYPAGMTINSTTGLIEWTPAATGDYDVTVEASNDVGTDDQAFTLSVIELPPCPENMTHYWKLDEADGPVYEDFFGTNDAECQVGTCPTSTSGIVDGGLYFDGVDDEVVIPHDGTYDWGPDDDFSIEFWMRKSSDCEGSSSSDNSVIVSRLQGAGGTNLQNCWVGINCSNGDGTQGGIRFVLRDQQTGGAMLVTDENYVDDAWHHVVAIRDGGLDSLYLYVDGQKRKSTYWDYVGGFDDTTHIGLGYYPANDFYRYDGYLDELALYDKVMPEDEILSHYGNGLLGFSYCDDIEIAPEIVSTPATTTTVGQLYQYNVDATGVPAPTYELVAGPGDMTIDENTGLIQWTPTMPDDYEITVRATNIAGQDEQTFTLTVTGAPPCPPGLQHYWMLEESGSPYYDFQGNADATAVVGSPTQVSGQVGYAQLFVRSESDGLSVSDATSFDWEANSSFSVAFWMLKETGCEGDDNQYNNIVIGRYDDDDVGDLNIFWVGVNCRSSDGPQGTIRYVLREDATTGHSLLSSTIVTDGAWHYVVAVRDGDLNESSIYIDGELDASMPYEFSTGFSDDSPATIGYINFGGFFGFDGYIDELALFDRALEASEIEKTYYGGLAGLNYCQICGDVDYSGGVDIDDVVYLITHIFGGGPAPVIAAAGDADCSGNTDIDDVVYLIAFIFSGGPRPCQTCPVE
jgi:hypothetical protein